MFIIPFPVLILILILITSGGEPISLVHKLIVLVTLIKLLVGIKKMIILITLRGLILVIRAIVIILLLEGVELIVPKRARGVSRPLFLRCITMTGTSAWVPRRSAHGCGNQGFKMGRRVLRPTMCSMRGSDSALNSDEPGGEVGSLGIIDEGF